MASKRLRLEEEQSHENLIVQDSFEDEDYEPEIKKIKLSKTPRSGVVRIWSDEEEISLLNGVINFSTEKGLNPFTNKTAFVDFMKESVVSEFTKTQLMSKLKRMKKKFNINRTKGRARLEEPRRSKVFELCSKIWGDATATATAIATANGVADVPEPEPELDLSLLCGNQIPIDLDETFSGLGEDILEEVMAKIGEADREKFKKQWKELQVLELELTLKRAELVEFETKIILDAYQASKMK